MWQRLQSDTHVVQNFVDFSLDWLEERRYALTIDVDMSRWAAVMAMTSTSAFVNPVFDPRHNRLSASDCFWLDVRAGSRTVATCAGRLFVTDDYLALKRSMKLWCERPPADAGELAITVEPGTPRICGRVGHEGGLWVHPDHRKRGLSVILPHLTRALCFRQWDVEWQTGVARQGIGQCGIVSRAYGMPHAQACFEGYFPLTRSHEKLYLVYMSGRELMAGLDLDAVAGLLPDRYQQPAHAGALVQKR